MNFTWKSLKSADNALESLVNNIAEIRRSAAVHERTALRPEKLKKIDDFRNRFITAIENDLNTAEAIAVLWETVKSNIAPSDKYELILLFDEVFGLDLKSVSPPKETIIPTEVEKLAQKREEYRKSGNFKKADFIREKIEKKGFVIEDTPLGYRIKYQK